MNLTVQREPSFQGVTYGKLLVNDKPYCDTLEDLLREVPRNVGETLDAWVARWKVKYSTAIPALKYKLIIDDSIRFKRRMPHVLDVPGFTGIRIHALNTAEQTAGCLGVGLKRSIIGGLPDIEQSRAAFDPLFTLLDETLKNEDVWIEYRNPAAVKVEG